jgi:hypothetical protein
VSRPALGPTQPPVKWVTGVLSPGVKSGRGVMLTTHPHLVPKSWMSRSYTSSPQSASMACRGTALLLCVLHCYLYWRTLYRPINVCVSVCHIFVWRQATHIVRVFYCSKVLTEVIVGEHCCATLPFDHSAAMTEGWCWNILLTSSHLGCQWNSYPQSSWRTPLECQRAPERTPFPWYWSVTLQRTY